jgi:hypothetical protein
MMNTPERIIELDRKLDEVILARGQRLEFAYEQDKEKKSGVGAVLGGAAGVGAMGAAGYGAYKYGKNAAGRARRNRTLGIMQKSGMAQGKTGGPTTTSGVIKQDAAQGMESAKKKASEMYNSRKGKRARAKIERKKRGAMGMLKGLRKRVIGYSEPTPEDLMEFQSYGDIAREQAKAKKNTTTARAKRMAKANAHMLKKKFNSLPRNKKMAVIAALGGAGMAGAYGAGASRK